jgi:hypothetical protein
MMKLEIGKEYLYTDLKTKCKLVCISEEYVSECLIVYKGTDDSEYIGWVPEDCLTELPPYHDFKRGEPVMAVGFQGCLYRKYFSHVGSNGDPFCFQEGKTEWASEGRTSAWESVRKLTPEEREEYNKCI